MQKYDDVALPDLISTLTRCTVALPSVVNRLRGIENLCWKPVVPFWVTVFKSDVKQLNGDTAPAAAKHLSPR